MDIVRQLKRDEGFRNHVYIDTVGKRTIGYGHNLDAHPISWITDKILITDQQAADILMADVIRVKLDVAGHLPWAITTLNDARLGVLENMAFNIGISGLLEFKRMLAALQAGDYNATVHEMWTSKWYLQVGQRGVRLRVQMLSGEWQ